MEPETRTCLECGVPGQGARCEHCEAIFSVRGYVCRELIARTAHSRAWLAEDAHQRRVFLKELRFAMAPNPKVLEAFEREARMLRQLRHPAVPRFIESFSEGEGPRTRLYLVQEFVEGRPLAEELQRGALPEAAARDIARQVLEILTYLQSLSPKVIHRDVKPLNLLRRPDGHIALVDFGAARDLTRAVTHGATLVGTFGYMPLEQLGGTVDETTDLYGLGATLVHLLGQRPPWELLAAGHDADLTRELRVSPPFRLFLRRLVAAQRQERFPSAAEAREALDNLGEARSAWLPRIAVPGGAAVLAAILVFLVVGPLKQGSKQEVPAPQASTTVQPPQEPPPSPPEPPPSAEPTPLPPQIEPPPEAAQSEFPFLKFSADRCGIQLRDMDVDPAGNVLVTGTFDASSGCELDFGGGPLRARGYRDAFLASFSATGLHRYSTSLSAADAGGVPMLREADRVNSVRRDTGGGSGHLAHAMIEADPWGNTLLLISPKPILRKLSPEGQLLWQYALSGRYPDDLAVDTEGNAYIIGRITRGGESHCELLKVDSSGRPVWSQSPMGDSNYCFAKVAVSPDGKQVVAYVEWGGMGSQQAKNRERQMYLVTLNTAGEILLRRQLEVDPYLVVSGFAVDASGIHLVGHERDRNRRTTATLLAYMPADGGGGRVRRIETPALEVRHVSLTPKGELLLTGDIDRPLTLDEHRLAPTGKGRSAMVLAFQDVKLSRASILPLSSSTGAMSARLPRGDVLVLGTSHVAENQDSLFLQPLPGFSKGEAPAPMKEGLAQ